MKARQRRARPPGWVSHYLTDRSLAFCHARCWAPGRAGAVLLNRPAGALPHRIDTLRPGITGEDVGSGRSSHTKKAHSDALRTKRSSTCALFSVVEADYNCSYH